MSDSSLLIGILLATLMGCAAAPRGGAPPAQTRRYYIAADSVDWNYAPGSDTNLITGAPYDSVARFYASSGPTRIGHVLEQGGVPGVHRLDLHSVEAPRPPLGAPRHPGPADPGGGG